MKRIENLRQIARQIHGLNYDGPINEIIGDGRRYAIVRKNQMTGVGNAIENAAELIEKIEKLAANNKTGCGTCASILEVING